MDPATIARLQRASERRRVGVRIQALNDVVQKLQEALDHEEGMDASVKGKMEGTVDEARRTLGELTKLQERSHAFNSSLWEEEGEASLGQVRSNLMNMSINIQDTDLAEWLSKRSDAMGQLFGSDATGKAIKKVVLKAVDFGEQLTDAEMSLERSLESELHYVMKDTSKISAVAYLLSIMVFIVPLLLLGYGVMRVGQSISTRQYILLGHIFNFSFVAIVWIAFFISEIDPLFIISVRHEILTLVIMGTFAIQFPVFVCLLILALVLSRTRRQRAIFGAQIAVYLAVAGDFGVRVWGPTMARRFPLSHAIFAYLAYAMVFGGMLWATLDAVETGDAEELVKDIERVSKNWSELRGQSEKRVYARAANCAKCAAQV
eukprot:CAMPEP_0174890540 /NCGR_PEP_ID=MMETSP0167-20121228/5690_1 /TAXON_ID=38298 /ORGANISM="Rhodella maculata, Strain CCMP736" /LENGTH=374 /DNA_ID=CAMNT_0016128381 /DNA_START=11 /DNA_END=1136 /DNA_ORIENTATION=-